MRILIVRHAEPDAVPADDPRTWRLSAAGRTAARRLRPRLPREGRWVSSTEAKAHETLLCAAGREPIAVARDAGFDEVRRDEPFDEDFLARRLAWVSGEPDERHAGWETPQEAAARFGLALARHTAPDAPLVVASHGLVITAWLVHGRGRLDPSDAGRFWQNLAFPDVVELDVPDDRGGPPARPTGHPAG